MHLCLYYIGLVYNVKPYMIRLDFILFFFALSKTIIRSDNYFVDTIDYHIDNVIILYQFKTIYYPNAILSALLLYIRRIYYYFLV